MKAIKSSGRPLFLHFFSSFRLSFLAAQISAEYHGVEVRVLTVLVLRGACAELNIVSLNEHMALNLNEYMFLKLIYILEWI